MVMLAKMQVASLALAQIHAGDYPIASENGTAGAAILFPQVLGRVTASLKLIPSDPAATDGSQIPVGISCFPAAADGEPIAWFSSGGFDAAEINMGDWTAETISVALDRTPLYIIETDPI